MVHRLHRPQLRQHLLGRLVLGHLGVCVDHVVVGVRCAVIPGRCRLGRGAVGLDRVLPGANPGEDMRRHVQSMRSAGRDLRVAARGIQALGGDRRVVVGVDEIVGRARMIGLLPEDRLQNRRRAQLVLVGLVGGIEGGRDQQGVQDRCLAVLRIALRHFAHRLFKGQRAGAVGHRFPVLVEHRQGVHVVPFALGLEFGLAGLFKCLRSGGERLRRERDRPAERIVQRRERPQPMCHGAARIRRQYLVDRLGDVGPGIGVVIGHREIEMLLRLGRAADLEFHLAQDRLMIRVLGAGGTSRSDPEDDTGRHGLW